MKQRISGPVPGTQILRGQASERRYRTIDKFRNVAKKRGYELLELPIFQPAGTFIGDVVPKRYGWQVGQVILNVFDPPFRSVELAYELTKPTTQTMKMFGMEVGRFAYAPGRVVRIEENATNEGKPRLIEFRQLGIENFVLPPIPGNIEAIDTFVGFVKDLNVPAKVRISSVDLLRKILTDGKASKKQQIVIKGLLDKNEMGALDDYLQSQGLNGRLKDRIFAMSEIGGDLDTAVKEVKKKFPEYSGIISDLTLFSELAKDVNIYDSIDLDQKAQRGLLFYTKMGFQGDINNSGECMGGGDYTIKVEGKNIVGSGFGIGLERLESVMDGIKGYRKQNNRYLVVGTKANKVLSKAASMRQKANVAETYIGKLDDKVQKYAKDKVLEVVQVK